MKQLAKILLVPAFLTLFFTLSFIQVTKSQPPLPPSKGHSLSGNQEPAEGAPIGSGIEMLIVLGALYAGKKVYEIRKDSKNDAST